MTAIIAHKNGNKEVFFLSEGLTSNTVISGEVITKNFDGNSAALNPFNEMLSSGVASFAGEAPELKQKPSFKVDFDKVKFE